MKTSINRLTVLKQLLLAVAMILPMQSAMARVSDQLEGLGDMRAKERAALLESRTRVGIVQNRTVPRDNRLELGVNYGPQLFGDAYTFTQNLGAQADFHFNPRFSLGLRYSKAFSSLTNEGQNMAKQAKNEQATSGGNYSIPQTSFQDQSYMALVNWYMMYGKVNLFDVKTVQFDLYSLAGYGQVKVDTEYAGKSDSQWNNTWTAGGGLAFWLTQNFTSRIELRYQNYSDKLHTGTRDLNLMVASFAIGVLL